MRVPTLLSTLLSASLLVGAAVAVPVQAQDLSDRVRTLGEPFVKAERVVGMSIGVIRGDEIVTVHLGKTADDGEAPDDHTLYEIGSASKVFTGLLLADAVSQGEVTLEQPAQDLMPDGTSMPARNGKQITLVDLSTHRSGLPRLADNMPSVNSDNPYADYTSDLAVEFLKGHQLRRDPGAEYEYSNLGVAFLGSLLSQRAEMSYEALLQKRVCGPLGMKETMVALDADARKRLATPHASIGFPTTTWEFADMPGVGGIRSSVRDMLLFAKANLDPPDSEVGEAIELAWKQHRPGSGKQPSMGLGWHFAGDGMTRWHNGQTGGFHSMVMVNRALNSAVVVLANTATGDVDPLAAQIIRMLAGAPEKPRTFAEEKTVPVEKMKRYEGRYRLAPGFDFLVKVDKERLMVKLGSQPTFEVFPKSETVWFYKVVEAELTFQIKDGADKADSLVLFQNGVKQTAKRVK